MMKSRLILSSGLFLAASLVAAANPVGVWTGKLMLSNIPKLPANVPAAQRAQIQQSIAMLSKLRLSLNLKADKTYVMKTSGAPVPGGDKPHTGKWSQKGNVITTQSTTQPGPPQSLTLSADGKTMTLLMPQGRGKIVFTK